MQGHENATAAPGQPSSRWECRNVVELQARKQPADGLFAPKRSRGKKGEKTSKLSSPETAPVASQGWRGPPAWLDATPARPPAQPASLLGASSLSGALFANPSPARGGRSADGMKLRTRDRFKAKRILPATRAAPMAAWGATTARSPSPSSPSMPAGSLSPPDSFAAIQLHQEEVFKEAGAAPVMDKRGVAQSPEVSNHSPSAVSPGEHRLGSIRLVDFIVASKKVCAAVILSRHCAHNLTRNLTRIPNRSPAHPRQKHGSLPTTARPEHEQALPPSSPCRYARRKLPSIVDDCCTHDILTFRQPRSLQTDRTWPPGSAQCGRVCPSWNGNSLPVSQARVCQMQHTFSLICPYLPQWAQWLWMWRWRRRRISL